MKLNINKSSYEESLSDNRELVVTILVFLVSIGLFIFLILPNILSFSSKKSERDIEVSELIKIKEAKRVLDNANQATLDKEAVIVSKVLPADKNFEIILNSISSAAKRSRAQIAGYKFADSAISQPEAAEAHSKLTFEIDIFGGVDAASNFIDELYKSYPIVDVKDIKFVNEVSSITVEFYYKPFTSVSSGDVALAREKSPEEKKALEVVSEWSIEENTESVLPALSEEVKASESASPF